MIIVQVRLIDAMGRGYITDAQYDEYIADGLTSESIVSVQLTSYPTVHLQSAVSITSSGQSTIVTPTLGKALNINKLWLKPSNVYDDEITYILKMGGTAKTGSIPISYVIDHDFELYPLEGTTNQVFTITLSAAVALEGYVIYYEI